VVDAGGGHLVAVDCERIPKPSGIPHALVNEARARSAGAVVEITLQGLRQVHLVDLRKLIAEGAPGA
jgi:purine-binding chemotaxis protein CheW